MKRRAILKSLAAFSLLPLLTYRAEPKTARIKLDFEPLQLPRSRWRELLEDSRFEILFDEDTERAFTSELNDEKRAGMCLCAACYLPLFESRHKYDSRTGWPSFTQPIEGRTGIKSDYKLFLPRTEYHCARCGGHQGHVFNDGPAPRGERWCNSGLALSFAPSSEPIPPLRQSWGLCSLSTLFVDHAHTHASMCGGGGGGMWGVNNDAISYERRRGAALF